MLENFKFNKKFGQNFIFDNNLLNAIVGDSQISKDTQVLEIGAGAGTLTKIIAKSCKNIVSYEIDENLKDILNENLKEVNNSKIIFKDALKTDIKDIEKDFSGNYSIVANLPYYITTPLIFKFIEETKKVDSITIMIQKEVADRLVAKSGKDYGTISIILDFVGEVKFCRKVSRTMFTPAPNVDSAVVRIELNRNKYDANFEDFCKVVRTAFSMRRKTLLNNFSSGLNMTKDEVKTWLNGVNISESARAEELSTDDFVKLTKSLKK